LCRPAFCRWRGVEQLRNVSRTPEGIVFDITESGWKGAVKEVSPMPKVA